MSSLVDWELAERVASLVAGSEPAPGRYSSAAELEAAAALSAAAVIDYTGLVPQAPLPGAEWVSRRAWAEINLTAMRDSLAAIEAELAGRLGPGGPLGALAGATVGRLAAVQVGGLVGYASRRVLGQYEFPLLGPAEREPRLLFVAANIDTAQSRFDADPESVLRWIALHEVTHAVHFASTPWLAPHLGELADRLLRESTLGLGPSELLAAARSLIGTDPREMLRRLGETDPLTLLTPAPTRGLLAGIQAAMASVEGYAEHVMDAAAPLIGEEVRGLRAQMEQRRADRNPLARLLGWLLGLELKMRQYRDGKAFADAVVDAAGIETLNRAWAGPEQLPRSDELAHAGRWIERTRPVAATLGPSSGSNTARESGSCAPL